MPTEKPVKAHATTDKAFEEVRPNVKKHAAHSRLLAKMAILRGIFSENSE